MKNKIERNGGVTIAEKVYIWYCDGIDRFADTIFEKSELFSTKAMKLILKGYQEIIKNGKDYRRRILYDFMIGSNFAGIVSGNTGVGAVHALSYPLGSKYHVAHVESNYQF